MDTHQADHKTADQEALLASAESLHDHAKFLLEDQINYATSLRDTRKTISTLLAVIVGIGVFRLEFTKNPGDITIIQAGSLLAIRILFTAAVILFGIGGYFLYAERGILSEFGRTRSGGALSCLHFNATSFAQFEELPPFLVMRIRTRSLRLAYELLKASNLRVRRRLLYGWMFQYTGLATVFLSFLIYFWTMRLPNGTVQGAGTRNSEVSHDDDQTNRTDPSGRR